MRGEEANPGKPAAFVGGNSENAKIGDFRVGNTGGITHFNIKLRYYH